MNPFSHEPTLTPRVHAAIAIVAFFAHSAAASSLYLGTNYNEIFRIELTSTGIGTVSEFIPYNTGNIGGIDVSATNQRVYWTVSSGGGSIRSANRDGSGIKTVLTSSPQDKFLSGVAIDDTNNHIYYADRRNNAIYRSTLSGSDVQTIIPPSGSPDNEFGFAQICLDVNAGHIYWADNRFGGPGGSGFIYRANLDGSNKKVIRFAPGAESIEIDLVNRVIYWTEVFSGGLSGRIMRSDLDGNVITEIVNVSPDLGWPTSIVVDPHRNRLFWTEWRLLPDPGPGFDFFGLLQTSDLTGGNQQTLATFGTTELPIALALAVPEPAAMGLVITAGLFLICQSRKVR